MNDSECFDNNNLNILRGEFYCFVDYLYINQNIESKEEIPQIIICSMYRICRLWNVKVEN